MSVQVVVPCEGEALRGRDSRSIAANINRATLSISANISEGTGRFTRADRRNFFGIAPDSVQERVPLLELARRSQLLSTAEQALLEDRREEITRVLSGLIKGLANHHV
jgi:four helix bundle protein